ncbi:MAG: hypothetical protein HOA52_05740 [Flavobacteriales bacterium]|nr:hypothetical protein [Flavobacteriales bacterium]
MGIMKFNLNVIVVWCLILSSVSCRSQEKIKFGYHDASGNVKDINSTIPKYDAENDTVILDEKLEIENIIIDTLIFENDSIVFDTIIVLDSNYSIRKSDTIYISVLLPFYLDENQNIGSLKKVYQKSKLAISFLEGVFLSIDSLSNLGKKIVLNVYDTEGEEQIVKDILLNKNIERSNIIFGPLLHENFRLVKKHFKKDSLTLIINPLSSREEFVRRNKNVYLLTPTKRFVNKTKLFNTENREITLIDFNENNKILKHSFVKLINQDSLPFNEYNFTSQSEVSKKSCLRIMKDNSLYIILEEETVFVDRLISFMSTVDKDVVVIGDNSWIKSDKLNIESLMKLKVRIPISNYFDFTSLENRYLLDKFESKYNHKMDRFSLLSFKSILHFCSDIPQFNFVQLNENSGFINSDVRLYEYSDYQLIPVE